MREKVYKEFLKRKKKTGGSGLTGRRFFGRIRAIFAQRREGRRLSFLSPSYFLFFPIAVLGYFALPQKARNGWLLLCSWFFYLCAGRSYFPFLISTVVITYFAARALERRPRRGLLVGALCLFIGALGVFKYLRFGVDTLSRLLALAGLEVLKFRKKV